MVKSMKVRGLERITYPGLILRPVEVLFVVEEAVVDDHGQILRYLGSGGEVSSPIMTFVLFGSVGGLGHNDELVDLSVAQLVVVGITVVAAREVGGGSARGRGQRDQVSDQHGWYGRKQ